MIENKLHKKLVSAEYLVHCFDSEINALLSCELTFDSGKPLVIRNGADGETLILEEQSIEEMNLEEYGITKLISSSEYDPARIHRSIGLHLDRSRVLLGFQNQIYAVELDFGGNPVIFWNYDDNLKVGGSIEAIETAGSTRLVEII